MKNSVVILIHVLFWLIIYSSYSISFYFSPRLANDEFISIHLFLRFLHPLIFYLGYFFIMKISWKKKRLYYIIAIIIISYLILFFISEKVFTIATVPLYSGSIWFITGSLLRIFIDWFKKRNDLLILAKENASSNLSLLKSQINPHFLFNTLHNIDTLIYNDQDKASRSLVKLSDIMRYMINEAKSDFVDLNKEIEHLESYLSLEKLRLKNSNFLNYSIKGDLNSLKIAPMIMIPFVENAFKHSVDSGIENGINICVRIEDKIMYFTCANKYDYLLKEKDPTSGIGLETVKKRLDLIYRNKYKLSIKSDDSVFRVNLKVELNEN